MRAQKHQTLYFTTPNGPKDKTTNVTNTLSESQKRCSLALSCSGVPKKDANERNERSGEFKGGKGGRQASVSKGGLRQDQGSGMAEPRWESIWYHTRTQPQSPTRSHPPLPLNRGYGGIHRLDRSSFIRTQPQNLDRRLWHHHHRDRLPRMLQNISLHTAYNRTVCSGLARNLTRHVDLGSLMTSDSHQLLKISWLRDIPYEHSGSV
jgi:hypothetical protein